MEDLLDAQLHASTAEQVPHQATDRVRQHCPCWDCVDAVKWCLDMPEGWRISA